MSRISRLRVFVTAALLCGLSVGQIPSGAQQALPTPFAIADPSTMTPQQKLAAATARADIQTTYDEMDLAMQQKRLSDFLAHRDSGFASIDANGQWRSPSNCREDAVTLFSNLLSAQKRSVVQTIALKNNEAEVYVSRHGSIIAKNPNSKLYDSTNIDSESRDVFQNEGGHWVQYRSYTIAEEVIVNGKLVQTAPRVVSAAHASPDQQKARA
jgi:hypothetical protein